MFTAGIRCFWNNIKGHATSIPLAGVLTAEVTFPRAD